ERMSNSTISAMMMMMAGDMSSLNALPSFNTGHVDDIGLDDDTFNSSTFEIYIPSLYDSQLWSSYEYLNDNTARFIDCVSRDYLVQGELLKFFIIVRPTPAAKARSLSMSNQRAPVNQSLKTIAESTDSSSAASSSSSGQSTSTTSTNTGTTPPITIIPPLPSSSQNLSFEIAMRYSSDLSKSSSGDFQNAVNITEYIPKHSYVTTDMRNDHISSSKSSTSYLRHDTNNQNQSNQRFIGGTIEVSTPFETYIPNRDSLNQKPNYFRLSNGDIVFPIEIPIYVKELYEDKIINLVIRVTRSKNHRNMSNENKLDRLLQNDITSFPKLKNHRIFFRPFMLIQPLKLHIQPNVITLGTKSLVTVVAENVHPSLTLNIRDVNIYLLHVLSMEVYQGEGEMSHRQLGQITKTTDHFTIRQLTEMPPTLALSPQSQYSFVLSLEPLSLQKQLPPLDGFYTKVKVEWDLPVSCGQILSMYDLKVPPPATSQLMVAIECPSPVVVGEKFSITIKISNLSPKSKQININLPPPMLSPPSTTANTQALKLSTSLNAQIANKKASLRHSTDKTTAPEVLNKTNPTNISSNKLPQSTNTANTNANTINSSKYIPADSHIHFNEMSSKSLASFDETQRNSSNLLCLEKSIYVGDIDVKSSVSISVDYIALRTGIFEIQNITLYDRIEKKNFVIKQSLQIYCIDPVPSITTPPPHHHNNNNNNKIEETVNEQ
ncbi:hypothetical protein SAMD00019534_017090, partial [Acytostelium subglobosum LB1]|uniref:hypothetical protein n=1 Tax=Acytostelium subglobosum LB1 TaxID=1410327 RepID=UPI000644C1AA